MFFHSTGKFHSVCDPWRFTQIQKNDPAFNIQYQAHDESVRWRTKQSSKILYAHPVMVTWRHVWTNECMTVNSKTDSIYSFICYLKGIHTDECLISFTFLSVGSIVTESSELKEGTRAEEFVMTIFNKNTIPCNVFNGIFSFIPIPSKTTNKYQKIHCNLAQVS